MRGARTTTARRADATSPNATTAAALTLLGARTAPAQEGLAASIIAARQKNAQLMKQYSWNTRVELIENGAVKDTRIDQVTYGPDGNLQYTLLNDQGAQLPHGAHGPVPRPPSGGRGVAFRAALSGGAQPIQRTPPCTISSKKPRSEDGLML